MFETRQKGVNTYSRSNWFLYDLKYRFGRIGNRYRESDIENSAYLRFVFYLE